MILRTPITLTWMRTSELSYFCCVRTWFITAQRGKTQTPKSLALSIAVRQMSGCSSTISVLNGLGQCVSLSSTMAYDTAIAQLNIETSTIVPNEFVPNKAVNLIYHDNIDFGEEIKKQTHVTNGIFTQKIISENLQVGPQNKPNIRKLQRSLEAPPSIITPFTIAYKKTPKFYDKGRLITTIYAGETAERLDLA